MAASIISKTKDRVHYFSIDSGWNWVEDEKRKVLKSWKMGEPEPQELQVLKEEINK